MRPALPKVATILVFLAACGGEAEDGPAPATDAPPPAPSAALEPRVEIVSPSEGDALDGPSVMVTLAAHGFAAVPAGDTTPGSGHHHLFLDRDLSPAGEPIPAEAGHIVHIGTGAAEYTFETAEPGEHRLIAVVGDAVHVPLQPLLTDTVYFVVR